MSDDESVVDLKDILDYDDEERSIYMGGIDDRCVCTFVKGYMKRQAVYTCQTCLDISSTRAAICYPCSMHCHTGHDLIELYTKRNFRCDCGNSKFAGASKCCLWEEKDDVNENNRYTPNFSNMYCICQRPYPDENYQGNEEMFQCGICEDWYHREHLNMPDGFIIPDEYNEMTCHRCIRKYPFLIFYALNKGEEPVTSSYTSLVQSSFPEIPVKRQKLDATETGCRLSSLVKSYGFEKIDFRNNTWGIPESSLLLQIPSIFWSSTWRRSLCTCESCVDMLEKLCLQFLLDPEDCMAHYLKIGKEKAEELDQRDSALLAETLTNLPRPVVINVATGVNRLKEALGEFLLRKRDDNHVVTEEEVKAFFEDLRKRDDVM